MLSNMDPALTWTYREKQSSNKCLKLASEQALIISHCLLGHSSMPICAWFQQVNEYLPSMLTSAKPQTLTTLQKEFRQQSHIPAIVQFRNTSRDQTHRYLGHLEILFTERNGTQWGFLMSVNGGKIQSTQINRDHSLAARCCTWIIYKWSHPLALEVGVLDFLQKRKFFHKLTDWKS